MVMEVPESKCYLIKSIDFYHQVCAHLHFIYEIYVRQNYYKIFGFVLE